MGDSILCPPPKVYHVKVFNLFKRINIAMYTFAFMLEKHNPISRFNPKVPPAPNAELQLYLTIIAI